MAIGTLAAVGLGAGAIGNVISSAGANKASKNAANTARDTSLQVAAQNNALQRDIYTQNAAALSPYMQRGNAAGNQINALLGLGGMNAGGSMPGGVQGIGDGSGLPGTAQPFNQWGAYLSANPDVAAEFGRQNQYGTPEEYAQFHYSRYGQREGRQLPTQQAAPTPAATPAAAPAATGADATAAANSAFDTFRNSTGYQFRLGEGMNALNNGFAGAGLVRSGAAMKASQEYGQNLASGEFGNYLGQLQGQQSIGLGGASALAGVGQNYAGMVGQNNNNAGSAIANSALAQAANYQNPFGNALSLLGGGAVGYGRR